MEEERASLSLEYDLQNIYFWPGETPVEEAVREWSRIWLVFKRHLTMQRVQRVSIGDAMIRSAWKVGGEMEEGVSLAEISEFLRLARRKLIGEVSSLG